MTPRGSRPPSSAALLLAGAASPDGLRRGTARGGDAGRHRRRTRAQVLVLLLVAFVSATAAGAEDAAQDGAAKAWVRPQIRVNFRAAPANDATPLGIVKTGDEVRVLERQSGWARIRTGDDATGWLPESFLDTGAPPSAAVADFQQQIDALRGKIEALTRARDDARAEAAALQTRDQEREQRLRHLADENRDLRAGERWPYMLTGAFILGVGMVVGFLMRMGSSRRSSSRIRF
jgi:uncharacterized protein YgiM (DUF1202 family)